MPTPTNIHNPPAIMDIQDPSLLANSLVYDFLRSTAHEKIAFEFKYLFGPFKDLNGLTLEKLYVIYKKKFNVIPTNSIPSSLTMIKSKNNMKSNKLKNISLSSTSRAVIQSNKKVKVKSQTLVKGRFSIEEDNIMIETVQKYGKSKKTWKKLRVELNRSSAKFIKLRYERKLTSNIVKGPYHNWSIEEDKILLDCLFENSSMKNPKYISSILLKNIKDSKAEEKIGRSATCIVMHYQIRIMPLLLQYHQGTISTPWKYSVLQYIYENKLESGPELKKHMTEINKIFPWLNINLVSSCYRGHDVKKPLYVFAEDAMKKYKDKPAHTEKELKRCEEIIEYYDPKGEISEYKFCKIHEKCLKSHGCGSL